MRRCLSGLLAVVLTIPVFLLLTKIDAIFAQPQGDSEAVYSLGIRL